MRTREPRRPRRRRDDEVDRVMAPVLALFKRLQAELEAGPVPLPAEKLLRTVIEVSGLGAQCAVIARASMEQIRVYQDDLRDSADEFTQRLMGMQVGMIQDAMDGPALAEEEE